MYHKTSLVVNKCTNEVYYRKRSCDTNLTSSTPANQYQRSKIIQNTVRVPSSLYTMNLGALSSSSILSCGKQKKQMYWNQMSDRLVPSNQKVTITRGSSTKQTVTSSKVGAQSPGGIGCDIKHNSYDRYLNKIKGLGLRKKQIPLVIPVSGGKIIATRIIECQNDKQIFDSPLMGEDYVVGCIFKVGQFVYALKGNSSFYQKALIIATVDDRNDLFLVEFDDSINKIIEQKGCNELKIYFECDCSDNKTNYLLKKFLNP